MFTESRRNPVRFRLDSMDLMSSNRARNRPNRSIKCHYYLQKSALLLSSQLHSNARSCEARAIYPRLFPRTVHSLLASTILSGCKKFCGLLRRHLSFVQFPTNSSSQPGSQIAHTTIRRRRAQAPNQCSAVHTVAFWTFTFHKKQSCVQLIWKANFIYVQRPN